MSKESDEGKGERRVEREMDTMNSVVNLERASSSFMS